jgi:hypothetical protein
VANSEILELFAGLSPCPTGAAGWRPARNERRHRPPTELEDIAMICKPTLWAVVVVLSIINLGAAGFALGQAEPAHAGIHVGAALAFGLWARGLRRGRRGSERDDARLELDEETRARLATVDQLETRVSELENRLDFTERLLAQGQEWRQTGLQQKGMVR